MKTTPNNSHRGLLVLKIRRDSSIHKNLPRDHYSRYRKLCNKEGYQKATRRLPLSHKTLLDRLCRDPKLPLVPRLLFKQVKSNLRRNKTQTQRIYHIQINSYLSNNKSKMIQETINSILQRSKGTSNLKSLSLPKSQHRMLQIVASETSCGKVQMLKPQMVCSSVPLIILQLSHLSINKTNF